MCKGKSALTHRQTTQDENPLKVDHKLKHTENVITRSFLQQSVNPATQTQTFREFVKVNQ